MKYLIALLTAATGILHLLYGFGVIGPGGGTAWLLVLNGVGYLVLLVLFWMASGNGGIIRWILLAYTLITFLGYFAIYMGDNFGLNNTIGLIIKGIELLLIILLLLYRGKESVPAVTPAPASRMAPGVDMSRTGAAVSSAATSAAAGASVAPAAAAAAAVSMADSTSSAMDEMVDETSEMAADAGSAVGEVVDDMVDTAEDAVDYVGDKAGDVYDAATDAAGDAADAVGDMASDAGEAMADVAGDVADTAGDMVSDAGDALDDAGDALRSGAVAAGVAMGIMDEPADELAAEAAALDAAALSAEPTADELRADLEEYLRSFGPSSEFRKEIEYVEGIGAVYGQKLRAVGISTILDLMVNGATRRGRKHISDESGISQSLILTWVNHVDLFRIKGVAQEYADLLEQSGVDTVVELAQRNPANLHKRMLDINEQKKLVRRAPHASEVQSWVEQAKSLRRLIHY